MSPPRPPPAAVCVFDAYGTLFDLASATDREFARLGERAGPLAERWRAKQLEYTWLRSLMDAWVPFEQIVADALDYAMESTGVADEGGLRGDLLAAYRTLEPYPEVRAVLQRLQAADVRTAILSNGSRDMLDAAVTAAGLDPFLDAVLSVDAVRVFKPHRRVYQLALGHFGVTAGEISFQSANSWDAVGAAHFGMQVVWCNRSGAPRERLNAVPAAEVRSLEGLLPRLGL